MRMHALWSGEVYFMHKFTDCWPNMAITLSPTDSINKPVVAILRCRHFMECFVQFLWPSFVYMVSLTVLWRVTFCSVTEAHHFFFVVLIIIWIYGFMGLLVARFILKFRIIFVQYFILSPGFWFGSEVCLGAMLEAKRNIWNVSPKNLLPSCDFPCKMGSKACSIR